MTNDIWLVFMDTSGSMQSGFSGGSAPTGLVEAGGWSNKLEAAIELICKRLSALRTPDVALISFSSSPNLVFHSHASEFKHHENKVRMLTPGGGTNLDSAFEEASNLLYQQNIPLENYNNIRVYVVTDGLTDPERSGQAAEEFVRKFSENAKVNIGVLLIDKTPNGDETAYQVATEDDVTYAENFEAAERATGKAAASAVSEALARTSSQQRLLYQDFLAVQDLPRMKTVSFRGSSKDRMSTSMLAKTILPAINALERIQVAGDSIQGEESNIRVLSITQSSDIKASVSGIAKAVEVIDERFTPWKREHAQQLAYLKEEELELELRKLRAETMQTERDTVHHALRGKILEAEARRARAEAEQIEIENIERKLKLEERQISSDLMQVATRIAHDFSDESNCREVDYADTREQIHQALIILSNCTYPIEVVSND